MKSLFEGALLNTTSTSSGMIKTGKARKKLLEWQLFLASNEFPKFSACGQNSALHSFTTSFILRSMIKVDAKKCKYLIGQVLLMSLLFQFAKTVESKLYDSYLL